MDKLDYSLPLCDGERDGWTCTMNAHGDNFPHVATIKNGEGMCAVWWETGPFATLITTTNAKGLASA